MAEGDLTDLSALVESECMENLVLVEGKHRIVSELTSGQNAEITLFPLNIKDSNYFENEEDYLNRNKTSIPESPSYIHSLKYSSSSSSKPSFITRHEEIVSLIQLLKDLSNYQKNHGNVHELVFFQNEVLVLVTDYSLEATGKSYDSKYLVEHIQNSDDKDERKLLFINELIAFLSNIGGIHERFKFLLTNFEDFISSYRASHALYLKKYSFQKFKSELDKEIIDASKRLQSVINDAQSKLVAIPAALLLVVSSFDVNGEKKFYNIALVVSSIVFGVLLDVLIRNQFASLEFIKEDVNRFKNTFDKKKITVLGQVFDEVFMKLSTLHTKQTRYLWTIRVLIWIIPLTACSLFLISLSLKPALSLMLKLLLKLI